MTEANVFGLNGQEIVSKLGQTICRKIQKNVLFERVQGRNFFLVPSVLLPWHY